MNFIDLLKQYESDISISRENINSKLYEVPILHGRYHKHLYSWRRSLIKKDEERNKKYREKYYFYKDKFDRTLDEKQIKFHIETDDDYVKINSQYLALKNEVEQIENMTKHCGNLSFFINSIVEWEKLMAGK